MAETTDKAPVIVTKIRDIITRYDDPQANIRVDIVNPEDFKKATALVMQRGKLLCELRPWEVDSLKVLVTPREGLQWKTVQNSPLTEVAHVPMPRNAFSNICAEKLAR